jgi:hypothetical protein
VTSPDADSILTVYPSRDGFRVMLQAGVSLLAMCGVGFVLVAQLSIATPFKLIFVAVLAPCTLLILVLFEFAASRFLSNKPMLILDRAGLTDQSSHGAAGFVPWCELSNVRFAEYYGQVMLAIDTKHPEQFIAARRNLVWRWNKRFNLKRGLGVVTLSALALEMQATDLAEIIETRIAEARPGGVERLP